MTATAPALSVVAVFHEMRREAARTLVTLGVPYQRGVDASDFEVLAVDNGSRAPLRPDDVAAADPGIRLLQEPAGSPSPCAAINRAVAAARGEFVMVCIDGARMLSPGVFGYALAAMRGHAHPFVYTLGMHLGPKPQNESMLEGYDQAAEDALLSSVPWREDGYRLFGVASLAYSSREGYFGQLSESNCFALRRDDFLALGGMDEAFASAGGGLANLDFFNRAHRLPGVRPVMLLGEASFHQFHGGVATNVPRAEHPWKRMAAEYEAIRGKPYANEAGRPDYAGWLSPRYHAALMPAASG
jgi:hypothetical protein